MGEAGGDVVEQLVVVAAGGALEAEELGEVLGWHRGCAVAVRKCGEE